MNTYCCCSKNCLQKIIIITVMFRVIRPKLATKISPFKETATNPAIARVTNDNKTDNNAIIIIQALICFILLLILHIGKVF